MNRILQARALLVGGLALALWPAPASAQLGRLKNLVAGVEKGEVYGLDVTRGSSIVFVVDLTPVVELPPGAVDNLRQMVAQQGEAYVRQKLAEEGADWALRAAGPAGMAVREVMARRSDRAERARNHVRAGIDGLDEDQRFGLVTFESGPQSWKTSTALASEANRREAREFVARLQKVEGDGFLRSALLAAAGLPPQPAYGALSGASGMGAVPTGAAMAGSDPAAMQAAMAGADVAAMQLAMAGSDPAAMRAAMVAAGASDAQVQAMIAGAALSSSSSGAMATVGPGTPPDASGPPVSAENLYRGIELALELEPETIVVVVAAAPVEDPASFLARVAQLVGNRDVTIHAAVFGEKQSGGVLGELAVVSGGKLLTESAPEE